MSPSCLRFLDAGPILLAVAIAWTGVRPFGEDVGALVGAGNGCKNSTKCSANSTKNACTPTGGNCTGTFDQCANLESGNGECTVTGTGCANNPQGCDQPNVCTCTSGNPPPNPTGPGSSTWSLKHSAGKRQPASAPGAAPVGTHQ